MIENELREWLARGLEKPEKSRQGLATHLGIDVSSVARMLSTSPKEKPRKMSAAELYEIADYLGEPVPFGSRTTELNAVQAQVVGPIAAGAWHDPGYKWMQLAVQVPIVIEPTYSHLPAHARRVEGTDFNAFFLNGDCPCFVPFWEARQAPHDGDIVELVRTDSQGRKETALRRVRVTRGGYEFHHESHDPTWQNDVLVVKDMADLGNIEIKGLYVGLFRPPTVR